MMTDIAKDVTEHLEKLYNSLQDKVVGRIYPPIEVIERMISYTSLSKDNFSRQAEIGYQKILEVINSAKQEEKLFTSRQKPHVRTKKQHVAILRLRDIINWPDTDINLDYQYGIPLVGPTRRSNYFEDSGVDYNTTELQEKIATWRKGVTKIKSNPPSWMLDRNMIRLEDEVTKLRDTIDLRSYADVSPRTPKTYAFGVEQGKILEFIDDDSGAYPYYEKLRLILDWRPGNKLSPQTEKIELYAHTTVQQMTAMAVQGKLNLPIIQTKKDVMKEVLITTKGIRKQKDIDREAAVRRFNTVKIRKFIPHYVKIDFKGYFWQNMVEEPMENNITYWSHKEGKYKQMYTAASQFGNIHSLWFGVRQSRLLQEIISEFLGFPVIIYIDDTIILVYCKEHAILAETLVCDIFLKLGFALSNSKIEKTSEPLDSIEILGQLYKRSRDAILIGLSHEKRRKVLQHVINCGNILQTGTMVSHKDMEKLAGNLIYLLYSTTTQYLGSLISVVLMWSCAQYYKKNKENHKSQALLMHALSEIKQVFADDRIPPIVIKKTDIKRNIMYTDASYAKSIGRIGGMIDTGNPEKNRSFEYVCPKLLFKTKFDLQDHIGLYELLSAVLAPAMIRKGVQANDKEMLHMIDNIPSMFWLVKRLIKLSRENMVERLSLSLALAEMLDGARGNVAYDYINTLMNPGDWFTREKYKEKTSIISKKIDPKVTKSFLKLLETNFKKHKNHIAQTSKKLSTIPKQYAIQPEQTEEYGGPAYQAKKRRLAS
jgi:hypothetical protein